MHKGFKCLDISSGRVYISRDVTFDENIFPFAQLHSNAGARLRSELLLLPHHLLNPYTFDHGGEHSDDHMDNIPTEPANTICEDAVLNNAEETNQLEGTGAGLINEEISADAADLADVAAPAPYPSTTAARQRLDATSSGHD